MRPIEFTATDSRALERTVRAGDVVFIRIDRTPFASFIGRSAQGRVAVLRLPQPLSPEQTRRLGRAIDCRLNRWYDMGFDRRSGRQFCSRFVREVLQEATGTALGEVASLRQLLGHNPGADLRLWRIWYFGRIPWERRTVTPASLYRSPALRVVFDGVVADQRSNCAKPL